MKLYYIDGYVCKADNKKEKKRLKKKGFLFFKTYERAENFRLADILAG